MISGKGYQRGELKAWNEVVWAVVFTKPFHGHLCDHDEDHVIEDSDDSDDNQVWAVVLTQA